jgi:hypothetical protein
MVTTGDLPFQETPIQRNIFEQTGRHREKNIWLLIDDIDNDIYFLAVDIWLLTFVKRHWYIMPPVVVVFQ